MLKKELLIPIPYPSLSLGHYRLNSVFWKMPIPRHDDQPLAYRLRHQHAVEGVAVMFRQVGSVQDMGDMYRQKLKLVCRQFMFKFLKGEP